MSATEEWRPIPSLDGWFDASTLGRIRSWKGLGQKPQRQASPKILAPTGANYPQVSAYAVGEKQKRRTVHSLVAEAFLGPKPDGLHVCHRDNDRWNNRPSNLRYGTVSSNQMDRIEHGTSNRGTANGQSRFTNAEVLEIVQLGKGGMSAREIGLRMGRTRESVRNILNGRNWGWLTGIERGNHSYPKSGPQKERGGG